MKRHFLKRAFLHLLENIGGGARASVSRAGLIRHKRKQLTLNLDRFGVSLLRKLQSCEVVEVNFDVT